MEIENARLVFEAVKEDDLKAFSKLVLSNSDLKIRFGRFPLLSVCYLYKSFNILNKFETAMLSVGTYQEFDEPFEVYKRFKIYAKKSLRLYSGDDAIVQPAEMLAILDNRAHLAKNYKKIYKTDKVAQNIKKIYILNKSLDVEISTAKIKIKTANLNFVQRVSAVVACIMFAFFAIFSFSSIMRINLTSGLGTISNPVLIKSEEELKKALDGGSLVYRLEDDITLSEEFSSSNFSGVLDGNGHSVFASNKLKNGLVKNLSGTLKNLKLEIDDTLTINQSYFCLAENLTGQIENCEVLGSLNIEARLDNVEATENAFISIFAIKNSGNILNSLLNVNITATNTSGKNIYLSGFVGENSGVIKDCKNVSASFSSDTIDLSGIAAVSTGTIENCINNSKLIQTTTNNEWNPNCAGIVITNEGRLNGCTNTAEISSGSVAEELPSADAVIAVYSAGIVADNVGDVVGCINKGEVKASSNVALVYAAGIVCRNLSTTTGQAGRISESEARCNVFASSKNSNTCAAGVASVNTSLVDSSGYFGIITSNINSTRNSFGAGICSHNAYGRITNCYTSVNFSNSGSAEGGNNFNAAIVLFVWNAPGIPALYSSGNKYVKNSTFSYSGWQIVNDRLNPYWSWLDDSICGASSVASVEELGGEK